MTSGSVWMRLMSTSCCSSADTCRWNKSTHSANAPSIRIWILKKKNTTKSSFKLCAYKVIIYVSYARLRFFLSIVFSPKKITSVPRNENYFIIYTHDFLPWTTKEEILCWWPFECESFSLHSMEKSRETSFNISPFVLHIDKRKSWVFGI